MEQLTESQLVSTYVIYMILKKLTTPFTETDAYKLGIIDKDGNVLRKRYTLKTRQERDAYTMLDTLVFNIKKMIEKIPGGKSRLFSYASALWLIKEANNFEHYVENEDLFEDDLNNYLKEFELSEDHQHALDLLDMVEDIANVGGAGVATDIPFKPKVKVKPEDLSKRFSEMYEDMCGDGYTTGSTTKEKFKPINKIGRRLPPK